MLTLEEAERRIARIEADLRLVTNRTEHPNEITAFSSAGALLGPGLGIKEGSGITITRTTNGLLVITAGGGGVSYATPSIALGSSAAAGAATTVIRSDSTIAAFDATTPANVGTAAVGAVAFAARRDHVHGTGAGTPTSSAPGDAAATGAGPAAAMTNHVHGRESYATLAANLKQYVRFGWAPDAAPGAVVTAGNQQGNIWHSGPLGFTATKLYVDAETAPGASGLPITIEYGDTNDLDTVAAWTTVATYTLSSEKSNATTTMTNAAVPADRLLRMNIGTIVGSPADVTVTLEGKEVLTT